MALRTAQDHGTLGVLRAGKGAGGRRGGVFGGVDSDCHGYLTRFEMRKPNDARRVATPLNLGGVIYVLRLLWVIVVGWLGMRAPGRVLVLCRSFSS